MCSISHFLKLRYNLTIAFTIHHITSLLVTRCHNISHDVTITNNNQFHSPSSDSRCSVCVSSDLGLQKSGFTKTSTRIGVRFHSNMLYHVKSQRLFRLDRSVLFCFKVNKFQFFDHQKILTIGGNLA